MGAHSLQNKAKITPVVVLVVLFSVLLCDVDIKTH